MRAAPPVQVDLADGRVERWIVAALYLLAGGAVAWCLAPNGPAGVVAWVVGASALGAAFGLRSWHPVQGRLCWDGQAWTWLPVTRDAQPLTSLVVQIDLGSWMLLRARVLPRMELWLVLREADARGQWHGLRVALAAHQGVAGHGDRADLGQPSG